MIVLKFWLKFYVFEGNKVNYFWVEFVQMILEEKNHRFSFTKIEKKQTICDVVEAHAILVYNLILLWTLKWKSEPLILWYKLPWKSENEKPKCQYDLELVWNEITLKNSPKFSWRREGVQLFLMEGACCRRKIPKKHKKRSLLEEIFRSWGL